MKKAFKKFLVLGLALLVLIASSVTAFAEVPYESYTYWTDVGEQDKAVYNRPMYTPELSIDAYTLGVEEISKITDITFDNNGNLYVLDSTSKIFGKKVT